MTATTVPATATCVHCGITEPNEFLLSINHGPDSFRSVHTGQCMAQYLVTNHILVTAKKLSNTNLRRTAKEESDTRAHLTERCARGVELGLDVAALLASVRPALVCGPCGRGEHTSCMEEATWDFNADAVGVCACEVGHDG